MNAVVTPLAIARGFAGTAAEHDRTGRFARGPIAALRETGLSTLTVPGLLGGGDAGLGRAVEVMHAIAEGDPSTALVPAMHYLQHGLVRRDRCRRPASPRSPSASASRGFSATVPASPPASASR